VYKRQIYIHRKPIAIERKITSSIIVSILKKISVIVIIVREAIYRAAYSINININPIIPAVNPKIGNLGNGLTDLT